MNDEIIGISVLQPIWANGFYRLWVKCRRKDGQTSQTYIFVRDRERNDLPQKVPDYPGKLGEIIWRFRKHGDTQLCVEPSLNYISFGFHNGNPWFTDYIELSTREELGDQKKDDLPTHKIGHLVHYELNLCQCQEDVDRYLDELDKLGALWKE